MTNAIMRALGFYDRNGLKYSMRHLIEIQKEIPWWPIQEQAKYADYICVSSIYNPFFNEQMLLIIEDADYANVNTTSVGNMAFLALYSPYEYQGVREAAKTWLYDYKEYLLPKTRDENKQQNNRQPRA